MDLTHSHDKIGIWSSALCIVHCLAVPMILAWTNGFDLHDHWWWDALQVGFILIGFWAVKHAVSHVAFNWLKYSFWGVFAMLVASVFLHHSHIGELMNYTAASLLILLHGLNLYLRKPKQAVVAQSH